MNGWRSSIYIFALTSLAASGCSTEQLASLQASLAAAANRSAVELPTDREPPANEITVQLTSALTGSAKSDAGRCTRALAKAGSLSFAGVAAPYYVKTHAKLCGVFPNNPGDDVSECFSNVGEGRLIEGKCRTAGIDPTVTMTSSEATFPLGINRPVREQYPVMSDDYDNGKFRALYWTADGSNKCAPITQAGRNLRCQVEFINENMTDAAGEVCSFNPNAGTDYSSTMDAIQDLRQLMIDRCSVKIEILSDLFEESTKRAYAFK